MPWILYYILNNGHDPRLVMDLYIPKSRALVYDKSVGFRGQTLSESHALWVTIILMTPTRI